MVDLVLKNYAYCIDINLNKKGVLEMKIFMLSLFSLFLVNTGLAQTDYTCVNDCTMSGSAYNFCKDRCTVKSRSPSSYSVGGDNPYGYAPPSGIGQGFQRMKQVDYTCMNRCTSAGYNYNLCKDKCEY